MFPWFELKNQDSFLSITIPKSINLKKKGPMWTISSLNRPSEPMPKSSSKACMLKPDWLINVSFNRVNSLKWLREKIARLVYK